MYKFDRTQKAKMWVKHKEKSGDYVPYLDERCTAAELDNLYYLLDTCLEQYDNLPEEVKIAIEYYHGMKGQFEREWGEVFRAREKQTCQKCRTYMYFDEEVVNQMWCPKCDNIVLV